MFVYAMHQGADLAPDPIEHVGRALARVAEVDGAIILLPMMRRLLTRVRASFIASVVPVDDAIDFHRLVGHTLFGLSVAHAGAFIFAYTRGHASHFGLAATLRGASGFALLGVFTVMWVCSLSIIRRSSRFELFYFTHLLYIAWLALAIVHAPSFALWVGVPLLAFGVEQIVRRVRRASKARVIAAEALRSGVTRLEIEKPKGREYGAGDYAFLRLPAIAKHEWHPFTISSAPERETLTFHVRSLGNWTSALRRLVESGHGEGALRVRSTGPTARRARTSSNRRTPFSSARASA